MVIDVYDFAQVVIVDMRELSQFFVIWHHVIYVSLRPIRFVKESIGLWPI